MMTNKPIDRTRRNLMKAATLAGGALAATAAIGSAAQAQGRPRGGDNRDGDNRGWGNHGGNHGNNPPGNTGGNQACFRRGTSILTIDGYRPVETLKQGDLLQTQFSGAVPIQAVPSFTITRSGIDRDWPQNARPILVKRGALGDDLPTADLCLTASHAIFKNGFLVPVGDLLNDSSIVFEEAEGQETLEFFHVELEKHDVIYADGAPCESLRFATVEPCVPVLSFNGNRGHLASRLRSAASVIFDRRRPLDVIRDELEDRANSRALAA